MNTSLRLKDFVSLGGLGVAAVAAVVGLVEYRSTSRNEFIKPLREEQLVLYKDASSAAAQIATLQFQAPEWTKAKQDFVTLYYGPMALLEEFDHVARRDD